jgi:uncharacterized protein
MHMDRSAARALLLAAQGLLAPPAQPATKADVLATIRRMGVLQIDTIHVVARSPYLVLWSRLGAYQPRWLDELLAEGALFEYWAHEASFLPIEDWPLYRRIMLDGHPRLQRFLTRMHEQYPQELDQMHAHVRAQGETRSSDFVRSDNRKGMWWDWKLEKSLLEALFFSGDLMIRRRENFQRIYDLRERILPEWDDAQAPPLAEVRRAMALTAVRALGVARPRWVPDYFRTKSQPTLETLKSLVADGSLLAVEVEGWKEPALLHPANRALAEAAARGELEPSSTTLLSPFDPIVWDRARALELFGFEYRIECYTPAPKRRYGYFTLPILRRGELIGRLDPKAHRKQGIFEVKALYLEPGVPVTDALARDVAGALNACAAWHGTPEVVVRHSDPPELAEALGLASNKTPTSAV